MFLHRMSIEFQQSDEKDLIWNSLDLCVCGFWEGCFRILEVIQ